MELGVTVQLSSPARVAIAGELDVECVSFLESFLRLVAGAGSAELVLDLSGVKFIDCRALGMLMKARRLAAAKGGALRLDHVPEPVQRVIELTRAGVLLS